MGRNLKPKVKLARRLGIAVTDKQLRITKKRPTPPGMHGENGYPRMSEFGKQLREKQRAKFVYGLLERQFRRYYEESLRRKGDNGVILFQLLEQRLDNIVYRSGFANTRPLARQLVSHGHIMVNGKKVNIPSYQVKVGDVITIRAKSQNSPVFNKAKEAGKNYIPTSWIVSDIEKLSAKVTDLPKDTDMTGEFNPKAIIEYYSR